MDETAAFRLSRPVGLRGRRNSRGPPVEMIAAGEKTQTCSDTNALRGHWKGKTLTTTAARSPQGNAKSSWRPDFPHCITDEGSPGFKDKLSLLHLSSAVDFKWAEQFKRLASSYKSVHCLRIIYCWEVINTTKRFFQILVCSLWGKLSPLTSTGSILAGSQRTLILFIHLQSLSSFLIHSFHSPPSRSTHRVRSVV